MFADLSIDWVRFTIAAVLLLVPLGVLHGKGVQYRELDRSWHRYVAKAFTLPWHWVDLARAFGGMWLLMDAMGISTHAVMDPPKRALALLGLVLFAGVTVRTVVVKAPEAFYAPCVFLLGLIAAFYPPMHAGVVLVSAVTIAIALRSMPMFFFGLAVCIPAFGFFFHPRWMLLAVGAVVAIVPAVLPMLFHREVVLAHRAVTADTESGFR